jgi:hypothetical protein
MTFAGCGLCRDVDVNVFSDKLYQWAATVTSSGRNMPLALPMRVNRSPQGRGFEVNMTSPQTADTLGTHDPELGGETDTGILMAPCFGVQMSFLRMRETTPVSVADITATVEEVAGKVNPLYAPACMQPYTRQLSRCMSAGSHTLHR